MIEDIEKWISLIGLAVGGLWGYFKLHARLDKLEESDSRQIKRNDEFERDIDELKENKTKTNTMLENLIKMQEENRLDVKLILQQIATLAANQNKGKDDE